MRSICLMFIVLFFSGCREDSCRDVPEVTSLFNLIEINHLEKELFEAKNTEDLIEFFHGNPDLAADFFYVNEYPSPEILANRILGIISEPSIDTLYQESVNAFTRSEQVVFNDYESAFQRLIDYYPDFSPPEVETIVSGLYNDLVITEEKLIIGIDYFIGDTATFRPRDIPQYILRRYTYDYLVPTTLKFIIGSFSEVGQESSLLSEMIDHGKVLYLLSRILPCTPDHEIIGFTAQEVIDVKANQEIVWASLVTNEALYETSEIHKRKFLGERPNVHEIGEKCPGRIGAWVGWKIVESYMNNNNVTVQELLSMSDHHELFAKSQYKPRNIKN